ncbi:MAG: fructose 1,6-bisphosphatase, partial [bacterium]
PFEPHRLNLDEMEYTTMPAVMDKLKDRFIAADEDFDEVAAGKDEN